jgi:hypothetical protein
MKCVEHSHLYNCLHCWITLYNLLWHVCTATKSNPSAQGKTFWGSALGNGSGALSWWSGSARPVIAFKPLSPLTTPFYLRKLTSISRTAVHDESPTAKTQEKGEGGLFSTRPPLYTSVQSDICETAVHWRCSEDVGESRPEV